MSQPPDPANTAATPQTRTAPSGTARRRLLRVAMVGTLGLLVIGATLLTAGGCSTLRFRITDATASSPLLATPPSPWPTPARVRLVTFNVKDMLWISNHRAERMQAIGRALAARDVDVVCLQEGFLSGDIGYIVQALAPAGLVHVQDYPSGVVGSGLWILSRYPIAETYFWKFTMNGEWHELSQGDWWAGKGVALARLELAGGMYLDVYNTHMIAGYGGASNQDDRAVQAREFAAFVARATPASVPALLAGDFNCGPWSQEYQHMEQELGWQRVLTVGTSLDHVFGFSHGGRYDFRAAAPTETIRETIQVGEARTGLSDHSGYLATVEIRRTGADSRPQSRPRDPQDR